MPWSGVECETCFFKYAYFIFSAALNLEPEIPDYDIDSEDERWLSTLGQKIDIAPIQFERIMETLEKQSEFKVGLFHSQLKK